LPVHVQFVDVEIDVDPGRAEDFAAPQAEGVHEDMGGVQRVAVGAGVEVWLEPQLPRDSSLWIEQ
jgi:hypothetical protein